MGSTGRRDRAAVIPRREPASWSGVFRWPFA